MIKLMRKINARMQRMPTVAFACGLFLTIVLGGLDHKTGYELSFSLFYMIPVMWITWVLGRKKGYVIALISALLWAAADLMAGHVYPNAAFLVWNSLMRLGFFLLGAYLLSRLNGMLTRERDLARTDLLTGIFNSKAFFEMTQLEIYRCRRNKKPLTVAFIDCDDFKEINDRFGHSKGDVILQQIADVLRAGLRATDILARLGGDEFGMVLPEASAQDANTVFVRLRNALNKTIEPDGIKVTISVGIATFNTPPVNVNDLIAKADELMYAVKKHGKNRVNIATIP
jgi:diguanylate cyclase (GGDEF)-like protein